MTRSIFLLPAFAVLTACASAGAALASDQSPASKIAAGDAVAANRPPMIVQNADGTMTIRMAPATAQSGNQGLVIPPQIVVPFTPRR